MAERSVLTEKVARKGTHLTREYSVDPLEVFLVREVMPRNFVSFRSGTTVHAAAYDAADAWAGETTRNLEYGQRLFPVLDEHNHLIGLITRHQMLNAALQLGIASDTAIDDIMIRDPVVGYPDTTLRELANLMASREVSSLPIVDRTDTRQVHSVMALEHVLAARLLDIIDCSPP